MPQILIFLIGAVIGGGVAWFLIRKRPAAGGLIGEQTEKKRENKEKILELLSGKDRITNSEVERALGVSDATATRYLDELEKQRIRIIPCSGLIRVKRRK